MKKVLNVVKVCLAVLLVFSVVMAVRSEMDRRSGAATYREAAELAGAGRQRPTLEGNSSGSEEAVLTTEEFLNSLDLAALQAVNPDVAGWLEIPGTDISYPLLQGKNNQFYLSHTWNGSKNGVGSIFLESKSSRTLDDFHTLIYGHRVRDGSMFGGLRNYEKNDYWKTHSDVYILGEDGVYWYKVFAAREASVKGLVYRLDLVKENLEQDFIQDCLDNSVFDSGIVPGAEDRILTLSTCTNTNGGPTRWVVHCVLQTQAAFAETGKE